MYWDASNLQGWGLSQKLPLDNFELEKIHQTLMRLYKYYNENSDKGDIFAVDVEYPKKLHDMVR